MAKFREQVWTQIRDKTKDLLYNQIVDLVKKTISDQIFEVKLGIKLGFPCLNP